ncbi:putative transcription factor far1-related [Golovinomyces cichoracearum]|uniref:Putative transcription factor far1-related n=1 Tax=Golovinomyces cichoracearum TaxID=62708 RepID=A0A420ICK4_9PEZI|nr:putative transcription factor far1-related [Golovinomyces cichoracearum]
MSNSRSSFWEVVTGSSRPPGPEMTESRSMIPPPECSYDGERLDRACGDCQVFARNHGYHLRRAPGSDKSKGRIYLVCNRSGEYDVRGTIRRTESQRTGCGFKVRIRYFKLENKTRVIHEFVQHNHGPSVDATTADVYHHCSNEERAYIRHRRCLGDQPRQALEGLLRQFPETLLQYHDVKNEFAAARVEESRLYGAPR